MNVYEKLNAARIKVLEAGMKKTGNNTYTGFSYFELSEILPVVNKVNDEVKLTAVFRFEKDLAVLEIVDAEKPEDRIAFTFAYSPDGAKLGACHKIQNEGAVQTYVKRYLYQNAYEIAEADALESTIGKPEKKAPERNQKAGRAQAKAETPKKEKKPFSEVMTELWEENPKEYSEVMKAHGYDPKDYEEIPQEERPIVYKEILESIKGAQNG